MESTKEEQELINEIMTRVRQKLEKRICLELTSTWAELWDEEERNKRKVVLAEAFESNMYNFFEDILIAERKTRDDYIERIETLLNEINDLQENLKIAIPYEDVESLPLHNMAYHLNKKAETYRVIKKKRVDEMNNLKKCEAEICKQLDMLPIAMTISEIPTEEEIKQFENHIQALRQEKATRSHLVKEHSQKIASLYKELDISPTLKFDKEIIAFEALDDFVLSNENMKRLEDLLLLMESRVEDAKEEAEELKEKLNLIWKYLDEPEEYRKNFLDTYSGYSMPVIKSLKDELERCKVKKQENISKIIVQIRKVLTEEWDKCLVAKEEREAFSPFYSDCFTEDLCDLHELEIERLRNYYRNNEQIFTLIAKHQKLFNKLIELEKISKNTNRYYNRGGQLLQEERERKSLTKELPIVEEELRTLLRKYEEDHDQPFTSFGAPMLLILDEQWSTHFDQKTIDKYLRMSCDKKKKTPLGKRPVATPGSSVANKISRLNSEKRIVTRTAKCVTPLIPSRTPNAQSTKKYISENKPDATLVVDSTYDEFQNGLKEKVESATKTQGKGKAQVRSTTFKEGFTTPARPVLRERNTPVVFRSETTAVKTATKTPMYSPSIRKTPKTMPRSSRRSNQGTRLTPAVNRLPLIF